MIQETALFTEFEVQDCAICLEILDSKQIVFKCGHVFHIDCISIWNKMQSSCPSCRMKIQKDMIFKMDFNVTISYKNKIWEALNILRKFQYEKEFADFREELVSLENQLEASEKTKLRKILSLKEQRDNQMMVSRINQQLLQENALRLDQLLQKKKQIELQKSEIHNLSLKNYQLSQKNSQQNLEILQIKQMKALFEQEHEPLDIGSVQKSLIEEQIK